MTTITTIDDARQYILAGDKDYMLESVRTAYNVRESDIDSVGDVWIADPGSVGHWLDDDALIALARRIAAGV